MKIRDVASWRSFVKLEGCLPRAPRFVWWRLRQGCCVNLPRRLLQDRQEEVVLEDDRRLKRERHLGSHSWIAMTVVRISPRLRRHSLLPIMPLILSSTMMRTIRNRQQAILLCQYLGLHRRHHLKQPPEVRLLSFLRLLQVLQPQ